MLRKRSLTVAATAVLAVVGGSVSTAPATGAALPGGPARVTFSPCATLAAGMRSMWVLDGAECSYSNLTRVDPVTDKAIGSYPLDSSAGDLVVADGSIWVTMYFDNIVERLSPTGAVEARIKVGFQPESLDAAFGSIWISNHHGASMSRIDPLINKVVATIPAGDKHLFQGGPQGITHDARLVYIMGGADNLPLEAVNPRNNRVIRVVGTDDGFCGDLVTAAHSIWSVDRCSNNLDQLDPVTGATIQQISYAPGLISSMTELDRSLWVAWDQHVNPDTGAGSQGQLQQRDAASGAVETVIDVGGDATVVRAGYGYLWVVDDTHLVLRRIDPGSGTEIGTVRLP